MRVLAYAADGKVIEQPRTLYIRRDVLNAEEIIAWAKASGFSTTLTPEDMHVTQAYSRALVLWDSIPTPFEERLEAVGGPRSVEFLGDKGGIVLKFESQTLTKRWQELLDHGCSWDYDGYHPHVTLTYANPDNVDPATVAPYTGVILLGPERYEELDLEWSDDIKENSIKVDYSLVRRCLDSLEERSLEQTRSVLVDIRDALVEKARKAKDAHDLARDLTLPMRADLRRSLEEMLRRSWDAGSVDARREVREGLRTVREYAARSNRTAFTPRAAISWLKTQAMTISGILSDKLLNDVKLEITNGIRTGRTMELIASGIIAIFLPYVGDSSVIEDGEQLAPYRLETIVRTNITTAYNHGRLTEFVSKDLIPFLDGVRYSSILDERTTEVCRYLDGKVFKPSSPDLESLLPPNHFNCRSIVVPVVAGEKIDKKDFITPAQIGKAKGLAGTRFLSTTSPWQAYREAA